GVILTGVAAVTVMEAPFGLRITKTPAVALLEPPPKPPPAVQVMVGMVAAFQAWPFAVTSARVAVRPQIVKSSPVVVPASLAQAPPLGEEQARAARGPVPPLPNQGQIRSPTRTSWP